MDYFSVVISALSALASVVTILTYLNIRFELKRARSEIRSARNDFAESVAGLRKVANMVTFPHSSGRQVPLHVFLAKWDSFVGGGKPRSETLVRAGQNVGYAQHTQKMSLDVLCRELVEEQGIGNRDVKQASRQFLEANPGVFLTVVDRPHAIKLADWAQDSEEQQGDAAE